MYILGISSFYHDSAACLISEGEVIAAAQEERFTRLKHDWRFPLNAVSYCLQEAGVTINDIGLIAFYEKPFLKFERARNLCRNSAEEHVRLSGSDAFMAQTKTLDADNCPERSGLFRQLVFAEHHVHASSSFFLSPFEEAAVLTIDGVGE
jgi:carbamoyltransferase